VSELPPASLAEVASTRLTEEDGVRIDWGARRRPGILNPQGLPAGLAVFSLSSTASAIGYADGPPACPTRWNTHRPPRPRRTTTRPTARPPPAKRGHSPSPDRTRSSPRSTAIPCSGPATPPWSCSALPPPCAAASLPQKPDTRPLGLSTATSDPS